MMPGKINNLIDVPAYQLCCGCGMCAYLYPQQIKMEDAPSLGRRPIFEESEHSAVALKNALAFCPGIGLEHTSGTFMQNGLIQSLARGWGPIFEVWEAYAVDTEIRFRGSSGGAMSAIALYCLEREKMHGVLHTMADNKKPYLNDTILSNNRSSILAAAGSRYSPASPCEKLYYIENASAPCVFIGKPCDVAAVRKVQRQGNKPDLNINIGLLMACFCAGTPSTNGTLEMLRQMGVNSSDDLASIRYRGSGWPGKTIAESRDKDKVYRELTYEQSWGEILQKYRQWRCYICPDHTGEFADISSGDPWYKKTDGSTSGKSLLLARTERGKEFIRKAVDAGYLMAKKVDSGLLSESQPNLANARARLWGQIIALKMLRAPYPIYKGFSLASLWMSDLTLKEKAKSIIGTTARVNIKKIKEKQEITFSPSAHD